MTQPWQDWVSGGVDTGDGDSTQVDQSSASTLVDYNNPLVPPSTPAPTGYRWKWDSTYQTWILDIAPQGSSGSTSYTTIMAGQLGANRYETKVDVDGSVTGYPGATYQIDNLDGSKTILNKGTGTIWGNGPGGNGYDQQIGLPVGVSPDPNSPSGYTYTPTGQAVFKNGAPYSGPAKPGNLHYFSSGGIEYAYDPSTGSTIIIGGTPTRSSSGGSGSSGSTRTSSGGGGSGGGTTTHAGGFDNTNTIIHQGGFNNTSFNTSDIGPNELANSEANRSAENLRSAGTLSQALAQLQNERARTVVENASNPNDIVAREYGTRQLAIPQGTSVPLFPEDTTTLSQIISRLQSGGGGSVYTPPPAASSSGAMISGQNSNSIDPFAQDNTVPGEESGTDYAKGSDMRMPGYTLSRMFKVGERGMEGIENPTNAPIRVINHDQMMGRKPMMMSTMMRGMVGGTDQPTLSNIIGTSTGAVRDVSGMYNPATMSNNTSASASDLAAVRAWQQSQLTPTTEPAPDWHWEGPTLYNGSQVMNGAWDPTGNYTQLIPPEQADTGYANQSGIAWAGLGGNIPVWHSTAIADTAKMNAVKAAPIAKPGVKIVYVNGKPQEVPAAPIQTPTGQPITPTSGTVPYSNDNVVREVPKPVEVPANTPGTNTTLLREGERRAYQEGLEAYLNNQPVAKEWLDTYGPGSTGNVDFPEFKPLPAKYIPPLALPNNQTGEPVPNYALAYSPTLSDIVTMDPEQRKKLYGFASGTDWWSYPSPWSSLYSHYQQLAGNTAIPYGNDNPATQVPTTTSPVATSTPSSSTSIPAATTDTKPTPLSSYLGPPSSPVTSPAANNPQADLGGVFLGTGNPLAVTSYPDSAYQNLPTLQYIQGKIPYSQYYSWSPESANGAFGTQSPMAGAINYTRAKQIMDIPGAYQALSSIYKSANLSLEDEIAKALLRAPVGNARAETAIET